MNYIRKMVIFSILLFIILNSDFAFSKDYKEIVSETEKKFSIEFGSSDIIFSSSSVTPSKITLKGYGKTQVQSYKFAKLSAFSDLLRNYTYFTEGADFSFNGNSVTFKTSEKFEKIPKESILKKQLFDEIYSEELILHIPDKTVNYVKNMPSIIVLSTADIKDGNIIDTYNSARNEALLKGLKYYFRNNGQPKNGKIFFQNILYNSLDEEKISENFVYIIQFCIDDGSWLKKKKSNKNLSKFFNGEKN